jgi:hypothetical protein
LTVLPPPQRSVPVRYAHLHYALGREQNKTPTTNRKRKVPNLFQDLTWKDGRMERWNVGAVGGKEGKIGDSELKI